MEAWFVSDIHLKNLKERNGEILLRFLHFLLNKTNSEESQPTHLFLLGDIFDLWLSSHRAFSEPFMDFIKPIEQLVQRGVKVIYFEGNHDMHIKEFWQSMGVEVYEEPQYIQLQDKVFRLEHGDLINPDDISYEKYRRFARHPMTEWAVHHLPGRFWKFVGENLSKQSRKHSGAFRKNYEQLLIKMVREHAERVFQEKPFDYVISGHLHVRDDFEKTILNHKIRSINLGSWFDATQALKYNGDFEWVELTEIK